MKKNWENSALSGGLFLCEQPETRQAHSSEASAQTETRFNVGQENLY